MVRMLRRLLFLSVIAGAVIAVKKKMGRGHDEAGTDA